MTSSPPPVRIPNIGHRDLPARDQRDWVLSTELTEETGITYRQLDYWCRTGLLTPREDIYGSGWSRSFHADQVRRARLIRQLLDIGYTLPGVRRDIDALLDHGYVVVGALTITVHDQHGGDAA